METIYDNALKISFWEMDVVNIYLFPNTRRVELALYEASAIMECQPRYNTAPVSIYHVHRLIKEVNGKVL